jgi:hypothetical protein
MSDAYRSEDLRTFNEQVDTESNEKENKSRSAENIETCNDEDRNTDAILTTAPWQYKLIALTTALMLPSNLIRQLFYLTYMSSNFKRFSKLALTFRKVRYRL